MFGFILFVYSCEFLQMCLHFVSSFLLHSFVMLYIQRYTLVETSCTEALKRSCVPCFSNVRDTWFYTSMGTCD